MPDDLDALLLRLRAQHCEPVRRTWKSPIEARLVDDDDDDDEPESVAVQPDPYSPDPGLYSPEWLAEFDRRCKAAVAEITAAIERAKAVEAHEKNGGRWVSKAPGDELIRCLTLSADRNEEDPVMATDDHGNDWWACDCEGWTFWPIDKHGNKVRWPERDGVML